MNLDTVTEVRRAEPGRDGAAWRDGDAWLAGGTWLYSEPQPHLRRLVDLSGCGWEPLVVDESGLRIAATCTIAELYAFDAPADWTAAPLIVQCCNAFLSSFKIWNAATVGGNVCMSLPAGPMISLAVALEGVCVVWRRAGGEERIGAEAFVTGNHQNVLQPGDLLRAIELPAAALRKRTAFRRMSLTHLGRSTALLVGTRCPQTGEFLLTVTAATPRPVRLVFPAVPGAGELAYALAAAIPDGGYFDDVHGSPDYRKHLTAHFAESIRAELAGAPVA